MMYHRTVGLFFLIFTLLFCVACKDEKEGTDSEKGAENKAPADLSVKNICEIKRKSLNQPESKAGMKVCVELQTEVKAALGDDWKGYATCHTDNADNLGGIMKCTKKYKAKVNEVLMK